MNDASSAVAAAVGSSSSTTASSASAGATAAGSDTGELAFIAILNRQMQTFAPPMSGMATMPMASPYGFFRQGLAAPAMGLPATASCGCGGYQSASPYGVSNISTVIFAVPQASMEKLQATLAPLLEKLNAAPILAQSLGESATAEAAATSTDTAALSATATDSTTAFPSTLPLLSGIESADELGKKLAENLVDVAQDGYSDVSFSVNHPLYGRIETRVAVNNGQVALSIASDNPDLRTALELAGDSLTQNLNQRGLTLAAFEVTPTAFADTGTGTGFATQGFTSSNPLAAALNGIATGSGLHASSALMLLNSIA